MLNDRLAAAKDVTTHLFALETAIDDALACAGVLMTSLPAARKRAKLSAIVGHEATQLTGETLAALLDARAKIVEAHEAFAEVRDEMGLKTIASGALWKLNKDESNSPVMLATAVAA